MMKPFLHRLIFTIDEYLNDGLELITLPANLFDGIKCVILFLPGFI
jgi:hypothetical protein